jgi:hypothetical protein
MKATLIVAAALALILAGCTPLVPGTGGGDFAGTGAGGVPLEGLHLGGGEGDVMNVMAGSNWHSIRKMALCREISGGESRGEFLIMEHIGPPDFEPVELLVVRGSDERRTFSVQTVSSQGEGERLRRWARVRLSAEEIDWLAGGRHTLELALRAPDRYALATLGTAKLNQIRFYRHRWLEGLPSEEFSGAVERIHAWHPRTGDELVGVDLGRSDGRVYTFEQPYIAQLTLCRVPGAQGQAKPYWMIVRLAVPTPFYVRTVTLSDHAGESRARRTEIVRHEVARMPRAVIEELHVALSDDDMRWMLADGGPAALHFEGRITEAQAELTATQKRNLKLFEHMYIKGLPRREFSDHAQAAR